MTGGLFQLLALAEKQHPKITTNEYLIKVQYKEENLADHFLREKDITPAQKIYNDAITILNIASLSLILLQLLY